MAKEVWGVEGLGDCEEAGPEVLGRASAVSAYGGGQGGTKPWGWGLALWLATVSWTVGQPGVLLLSVSLGSLPWPWVLPETEVEPHKLGALLGHEMTRERLTLDWAPEPYQHALHSQHTGDKSRVCPQQSHHCWIAYKRTGRWHMWNKGSLFDLRINCRFQPVGSHLQFATVVKNSIKQKPSGAAVMSWIFSVSTHI